MIRLRAPLSSIFSDYRLKQALKELKIEKEKKVKNREQRRFRASIDGCMRAGLKVTRLEMRLTC